MTAGWIYTPHAALDAAIADIRRRYVPVRPAGLEPLLPALAALGDPHLRLPPVFHVAGTNGKGSTVAFITAILGAAGLSCHSFISPHLVRFEERIKCGGRDIDPDDLLALIAETDRAVATLPVSFFEFFTLVAFLAFARHSADAVVLETGLGGRFDSTNLANHPAQVAVITRISFDHMKILGDTLPQIASEKAGIIKPARPVVTAPQPGAGVDDVFARQAEIRGARHIQIGRDVTLTDKGAQGFIYHGRSLGGDYPPPALSGSHQVINAVTALAAVEQSIFANKVSPEQAARGIATTTWAGRLQQIDTGALRTMLPLHDNIILDGAHNDSGAMALGHWLDAHPCRNIGIIAFKKDKLIDQSIIDLLRRFDYVIVTTISTDNKAMPLMQSPDTVVSMLAEAGIHAVMAPDIRQALAAVPAADALPPLAGQRGRRIVITGSLYLVGEALAINDGHR